ncbi:chemosensory pili system protein ChpA (sensor histidine kinase/response regulator) [Silvimonas terrae]|uniref:Chemotaxis protein CheA n=1 Tax=Silvimonas terrae TaxID=300266 RepID=A0A840RMA3_9NEIS|nr:Hpt domain-containing protein [Silvimonas terrae]MBB5193231.1 chemosensory pili system protein ChpA (sensor histidine kinase/response regulator) [Silvimonas terrae]
MSVHTEFDQGSLIWVKGELEQTLGRAAEALKQFGDAPDAALLKHAQTHLHQAVGALQMVELQGLARYCEEAEHLVASVAREETGNHALEAVIAVTKDATAYLERIAAGSPNVPLVLRDTLVKMAALRGQTVSGAELFFPQLAQLSVPAELPTHSVPEADMAPWVRQQRTRFESGLLRWLRARDAGGAAAMTKSLTELASAQSIMLPRAFWWSAAAVVDALPSNKQETDLDPRHLLMRLNLQLRRLADGSTRVAERLFRDLLYILAHDQSQSALAQKLRTAFELDGLLADAGANTLSPQAQARAQAARQLRDELANAKDLWSRVAAGQQDRLPQLAAEITRLSHHSEALEIPGLNKLWEGVSGVFERCAGRGISEPEALELATAMLLADSVLAAYPQQAADFPEQVEAMLQRLANPAMAAEIDLPQLDAVSREAQEKLLVAQLAQEMRSNLRSIEDALDAFFRDASQRAALGGLDQTIYQVQGALMMLDCQDAVALLLAAHERVRNMAASEADPAPAELEELAEAFSTIGFYVDGLEQGRDDSAALRPMLTRLTGAAEPEIEVEPDVTEALEAEPPIGESASLEPEHIEIVEPEQSRPLPSTEEAVDAELLEVYLEEAAEVLATIAAQIEVCRHAPHDREAMTVIRRAFHTLKGSGRMVGLFNLGEAAWAIEQVMNKWLQAEQPATPALLQLVGDAHQSFRVWVAQLSETGGAQVDASSLSERADELKHQLDQGTLSMAAPVAAPAIEPVAFQPVVEAEPLPALFEGEHDEAAAPSVELADDLSFDAPAIDLADDLADTELVVDTPAPADEIQIGEVAVSTTLFGIFCDEAGRHLQALVQGRTALQHNDPLAPSFLLSAHTLGGIGATAGFSALGDLAYALEQSVQKSTEPPVEPLIHAVDRLEQMLGDIFAQRDPGHGAAEIAALAARNEDALSIALDEVAAAPVAADDQLTLDEISLDDLSLDEALPDAVAVHVEPAIELAGHDVAAPAEEAINLDEFELTEPTADELAALALLDGTHLDEHNEPVLPAPAALDGLDDLSFDLDEIPADALTIAVEEEPLLATDLALDPAHDAGTAELPDEQGFDLTLDELLETPAEEVVAEEHVLDPLPTESAHAAEAVEPHTIVTELVTATEPVQAETAPDTVHEALVAAHEALVSAHESLIAARTESESESESVIDAAPSLDATLVEEELPAEAELIEPAAFIEADEAIPEVALSPELGHVVQPLAMAAAESLPAALAAGSSLTERKAELDQTLNDEIDDQLLPVFVEEGDELLPQVGGALRALRDGDAAEADRLKRILHTLKGSARMSGAMRMGEATHRMESRLLAAGSLVSGPLIDELESDYDLINLLFDELAGRTPNAADVVGQTAQAVAATQARGPAQPLLAAAPDAEGKTTIRVRSELVDDLVNQAGEVSIARSRIESEMLALKSSLLDLTENVTRLRTQMRELEIQAESQMQARTREFQEAAQTFDPLEFDRFTRLQEVTRFIAESVNDVATIQHNLLKNVDESAAALTAQARMTKELQQNLMRVRMVPFASISDRLYRLTRQTGKEVGKKVNLELRGGRVEIDRGVLEKMISPFEHMLRNAIDHGLETPAERETSGKSEFGEVQVEVRQEGNELVVMLKDDGKGLNMDRIRAKALERGLIEAGQDIADRDLMQVIFEPGFSTASAVTQISGRGIGMDVVKNEIGNLGGRIDVDSVLGQGTSFTIHLPLTLAVTQVLLVKSSERLYAIPSVMIEQVQELKQDALALLYKNQAQEWLGGRYPFSYFPRLLGDAEVMPETKRFSTVLLLRSGANRMALHIDELVKNQEVVVKAIGPQLARIPGVAGSTVLGNGEIVLIMNPLALLAHGEVATVQKDVSEETRAPAQLQTTPVVMVVDDSLTVRKITSRLLAREGFQVQTAKDGVDALQQLQELKPAVMLVDIEMPRMDGFEFTRNVRANDDTRHIPIIMITSRTAEKHRNYAFELGVNVFLGKPFQEDELMGHIRSFITQ